MGVSKMIEKYFVLFGILISMMLLGIATLRYPGGSQHDQNSTGYDWTYNYLSNLFGEKAVNGAVNPAQLWAVAGMLFLCGSLALFFIRFSKKITSERDSGIIKYAGISGMLFAFLSVTPYHDTMITIASTMALVAIFYITVFVFKSGLHFFKILSVACLLAIYGCNFMYYTRSYLNFLPIVQKIVLAVTIIWVLGLEYFTRSADFQQRKISA